MSENPDVAGTGIDTTVPHSARIWNYFLGGKDNYAVDRAAGDEWLTFDPGIPLLARTGRAFLARAVTFLAAEAGIRQFLDIGTGLPTANNTHEIAQSVAPDARVVYVDNDPLVLTHAKALLNGTPEGHTSYLDADMNRPQELLAGASEILDLSRPVAVMFMGVVGHVPALDDARALVRLLLDAVPSGSYLALWDSVVEERDQRVEEALDTYAETGAVTYHLRTAREVATLFDGLELVEPGFVPVSEWRPEADPATARGAVADAPAGGVIVGHGAVARKP